jgi:hypothetical protein
MVFFMGLLPVFLFVAAAVLRLTDFFEILFIKNYLAILIFHQTMGQPGIDCRRAYCFLIKQANW